MNFTYSQSPNKRSRTLSQLTNSTANAYNYINSAPRCAVIVGPKREVGGAGVQKAGSKGSRKAPPGITYRQLLDILCPIVRVKIDNYGINMYRKTYDLSFANAAPTGDLKMIRSLPTKQSWLEWIGLPMYFPATTNTNRPMYWSVRNLMDNAQEARTMAGNGSDPVQGSDSYNRSEANGNNILSDANQQRKKFCYLGGYQKHTFINHSNSQCFIEMWELHPRDAMYDFEGSTSDLTFRSVGDIVLRDFEAESSNRIGFSANTNITLNKWDSVDDPVVRINSGCKTVHTMFKVSSPVKICLAPGETFHYTMRFDPFTFDELFFTEHLLAVDTSTGVSYRSRPTSIPMFSKRLVMRCYGELGKTPTDMYSDINNTTGSATVSTAQPIYTGCAPIALLHTQQEYHRCRYMYANNKQFTIKGYWLDEKADAVLEVVNEEIDGEEIVDI